MKIRIATFNTGSFLARGDEDGTLTLGSRRYAAKVRACAAAIQRIRPDVIALQEVVEERALEDVLEEAGEAGAGLRVVAAGEPGSRAVRTWLLSRFPLVAGTEPIRHDDGTDELGWRGRPLEHRRGIVHARLAVRPGVELHAIAVHLKSRRPTDPTDGDLAFPQSFGDWAVGAALSAARRMMQAARVRQVVDGVLEDDPDARVCVLGDFNDVPRSTTLEAMLGDHLATGRVSLSRKELIPVSGGVPADRRWSHVYRGRRQLLDDILVSRALWRGFARAEIHNEALEFGSEQSEWELGESDHAPVIGVFRV